MRQHGARRELAINADGVGRFGLSTLSASDSKSGDRNPPKKESKVPGHRVALVMRTVNGSDTRMNISPNLAAENASIFEFHDAHAWSADSAIILSIGEGNVSRVYITHDGGQS